MDATWPLEFSDHRVIIHHHPAPQPIVSQPTPERVGRPRGSPEPIALHGVPFPGAWKVHAACRGYDPDLFFPHRGQDQSISRICAKCPVQIPCREYAVTCGATLKGIFGGLNERQRRVQRRRQAAV